MNLNRCPSKSRHVNIVPSDDADESSVVENVYVHLEIINVVEDTLVDSSTPILDEVRISSEDISDVVSVLVKSSTPLPDDFCVHEDDTSESDVLHLPVAHDELPIQKAICNVEYKFASYFI